MKKVSGPFLRVALITACAAALFVAGCGPKKVATKAPEPPPPPPARPTVTLQANPTSLNKGEATTLSWSSTNATQLTIYPEVGAVAPEGSTKVTPADSTSYTIAATGPGGSADASVRVTVAAPPPPPTPTAGPSLEELFLKEVRDAYFDLDKADLRPDARAALTKSADFLRNYTAVKVNIEGHCDERGSTEYNLALGDRRAAAVKQFLVSQGISADRMSTVSFGKEKPFCMESNEECWQQNRRGHFVMAK
ncbi:MAG TPA: peptidoglycan-associated lipoprotein Pal [Candidatus Sulfotelmatobacter sp.]|jgi:peptidoglycan-associated lipoprotein|nr:peptidoglycan-associated lipoprotein Pal [Candidatus Sulfotelmatobacter sp.]